MPVVESSQKATAKDSQTAKFTVFAHMPTGLQFWDLPFTADLLEYVTPNGVAITAANGVRDIGVQLSHDSPAPWTPHVYVTLRLRRGRWHDGNWAPSKIALP